MKKSGSAANVDYWLLLAVLLPLGGYLSTLAPSVTFFDSGEFMSAVHSLSSAHSPGYPFFILYAKLFTFIPLGSIAFRINVATAVSAALASGAVFLLCRHLVATVSENEGHRPILVSAAALAASLAAAFTPRLWLQSNHDKPYPLLSFIVLLMLYLILLWRRSRGRGDERTAYLYVAAFLAGLATGAHQTIVLVLPMMAFLVFEADKRFFLQVREVSIVAGFAILGTAVQLHLPVRALQKPLQNWGDTRTLGNFLWHLLRKGYPSETPHRDFVLLWEQVNAFNLPHELTLLGLVLILVAVAAYYRSFGYLFAGYLVGLGSFLLVIVGYFNTPSEMIFLTEEFFTPLYLIACVFAGLGLHRLLLEIQNALALRAVRRSLLLAAMTTLVVYWPASQFLLNVRNNWQRSNYIAHDYAVNSLLSIPYNGVFFTWGDSGAFPLWYLQGVERYREDATLLHIPHLAFGWYLDAFPGLFDGSGLRALKPGEKSSGDLLDLAAGQLGNRRSILVDYSTRYSLPLPRYSLRQRGICYELLPRGEMRPIPVADTWDGYTLRGVLWDRPFRDQDTDKAIMIYAYSSLEEAEHLIAAGMRGEAQRSITRAVVMVPELAAQAARIEKGEGL